MNQAQATKRFASVNTALAEALSHGPVTVDIADLQENESAMPQLKPLRSDAVQFAPDTLLAQSVGSASTDGETIVKSGPRAQSVTVAVW